MLKLGAAAMSPPGSGGSGELFAMIGPRCNVSELTFFSRIFKTLKAPPLDQLSAHSLVAME